MAHAEKQQRRFLFLQGPHGPYFYQLSKALEAAGASVLKVGFNRGDEFFWRDARTYHAYTASLDQWDEAVADLLGDVTDLVIYGDTRPVHRAAIELAKKRGITVHCFEEGYLRPYWVTYERGGVNGHSRLMNLSVEDMRAALADTEMEQPEAPARWGEMRQHILLGAIYHWQILFRNGKYKNYRPHRDVPVSTEFFHHVVRLLTRPVFAMKRWRSTRAIKRNAFVYHLGLLQLAHDASIRSHSSFTSMEQFMRLCIEAFAAKAPPHHHLVFKAHPLEDGRQALHKMAAKMAVDYGAEGRVHLLRGGKLAGLLDEARSVVTINSTAAQQAFWRGIPVKALGDGVYNKPEFASQQSLLDFFANPMPVDLSAYRDYRRYLLETSQITGGFYTRVSRSRLIRTVVDRMLDARDPYDALENHNAAGMQQLRLVEAGTE